MLLLPDQMRFQFPGLNATRAEGLNALALARFVAADIGWAWYAAEFDGDDVFFGLIAGVAVEVGYFRLSALEADRGALHPPIRFDPHFKPIPLRDLQAHHQPAAGL